MFGQIPSIQELHPHFVAAECLVGHITVRDMGGGRDGGIGDHNDHTSFKSWTINSAILQDMSADGS